MKVYKYYLKQNSKSSFYLGYFDYSLCKTDINIIRNLIDLISNHAINTLLIFNDSIIHELDGKLLFYEKNRFWFFKFYTQIWLYESKNMQKLSEDIIKIWIDKLLIIFNPKIDDIGYYKLNYKKFMDSRNIPNDIIRESDSCLSSFFDAQFIEVHSDKIQSVQFCDFISESSKLNNIKFIKSDLSEDF